jgi:RNA polymerase sigma factor (sigma-70 family)
MHLLGRIQVVEAGVVPRRRSVSESDAYDFAAWVEPHLPAMAGLAARLVPPGDSDDVVQEALLRAWRRWETYDARRGTSLAWLLAIVVDRARRHRRRRSSDRWALVELDGVADAGTDPTTDVDLERALHSLSHRQRLAVSLYYFVDLDVATTAQVMGCAPGTVTATLHQARERLRELLGEQR